MDYVKKFVQLSIICSLSIGLFLSSAAAMRSSLGSSGDGIEVEDRSQYSQYSQLSRSHYGSPSDSQNHKYSQYSQYSQDSQTGSFIKITSLKTLVDKIKALRAQGVQAKDICVGFDFHGVLVKETEHQENLTLNEGTIDTLQFLEGEGILPFVATAWNIFDDVINDGFNDNYEDKSKNLGLQAFFDVTPGKTESKYYTLGPDKKELVGFKNGRVVSLKYAWSSDVYYRRKAYAIDLIYPDYPFQYIFFVDDSESNLKFFQEDNNHISSTRKGESFKEMYLYLLENPQTNESQNS